MRTQGETLRTKLRLSLSGRMPFISCRVLHVLHLTEYTLLLLFFSCTFAPRVVICHFHPFQVYRHVNQNKHPDSHGLEFSKDSTGSSGETQAFQQTACKEPPCSSFTCQSAKAVAIRQGSQKSFRDPSSQSSRLSPQAT